MRITASELRRAKRAGLRRAVLAASALVFAFIFGAPLRAQSQAESSAAPAAAADANPAPAFEIADVHTSRKVDYPYMVGGKLQGTRYMIREASMVDLISTAYGVDADTVLSGPRWLERDRFDVIAKAPAGTPPDTLKLMLQKLLADRFQLVLHADTKPMAAFVLSVGKAGKPKLREATGKDETGCKTPPGVTSPLPYTPFECRNITMDDFAKTLPQIGPSYLGTHKVVNSTGLNGSWDFELHWTNIHLLDQAGDEGLTLYDALDKQLGLKLEPQKIPTPVLIVDSVNEEPTPNPPEVATALPPPPPPEFEVATIKPSQPGVERLGLGWDQNGNFSTTNTTLRMLIKFAWNLNFNDNDVPFNAPKFVDSERFDINAKLATDESQRNAGENLDFDQVSELLRKLLIERFKITYHMENREVNAYTLVAVNPKLQKADPLGRTGCNEGPGADGKDPRTTNPLLGRLVTCLNMSIPEFAEQIHQLAPGWIYYPVEDATGLQGTYDFTISFSPKGVADNPRGGSSSAAPAGGSVPTAADPSGGALSLFDAINKQLGLKLEMRKRTLPVLVIDHIEEKPTDN
jgi:uncharacterized protein (TIGR03435 family)